MNQYTWQRWQGIAFSIFGGLLIVLSLGDLLFRLCIAAAGFMLMMYGFRLQGTPFTYMFTRRFGNRRMW